MDLSHSTLELLRDEAYFFLCRDACEKRMDGVVKEAADVVGSRPLFGFLARKQTRDAFADSVRRVVDTEAALRDRLARITRLSSGLRERIRADLVAYLPRASPEFDRLVRLQQLIKRCEAGLQKMLEMLVAFARDTRALGLAASEALKVTSTTTPPCIHEFSVLRDMAVRLEGEQKRFDQYALAVDQETQGLTGNDPRLATMLAFRRTMWVDWLSAIPLEQVIAEVTRVEFEVRSFLSAGLQLVSAKLQATQVWCMSTQENLLNQYWNQLRTHALAHYVEEGDVDEVLEKLSRRYDSKTLHGQREFDPFIVER